jgi:hypothetical protein
VGAYSSCGESPHPATVIRVDSAYKIQSGNVKGYHKDITIEMFSWENTTKNYSIVVNYQEIFNGSFKEYENIPYVCDLSRITMIEIFIDGNRSYQDSNIIIISKRPSSIPGTDLRTDLIEVGRAFVSNLKRDQFFAIMTGVLLSIIVWGPRLGKHYRLKKGEKIVAGDF